MNSYGCPEHGGCNCGCTDCVDARFLSLPAAYHCNVHKNRCHRNCVR